MIMTKNPGSAGVANGVWHYRFFGGPVDTATQDSPRGGLVGTASPAAFNITSLQLIKGTFIVLAMKYPSGTNFSVDIFLRYTGGGQRIRVPRASSLAVVLSPTENLRDARDMDINNATDCPGTQWQRLCNRGSAGPTWYFDTVSNTFYLRVVNPLYYLRQTMQSYEWEDRFERNGMFLGRTICCGLADYLITTTCSGPMGMCVSDGDLVPGASRPSGDSCVTAQTRGPWGPGILPPRHHFASVAYAGETTALWQLPSGRPRWPVYNASVRTLPIGGTLSFTSTVGHTVQQMPSLAALQACDFSNRTNATSQLLFTFDPVNATFDLTFTASGTYYLVCSISDHCLQGMAVVVQVGGNSTDGGSLAATLPASTTQTHVSTCTQDPGRRFPILPCLGRPLPTRYFNDTFACASACRRGERRMP
eukprot:m.1225394 g.1225394  ORF g.1225394 m.1225394 type:complete len:420 (+) comp24632_c0_seq1:1-1260(+)